MSILKAIIIIMNMLFAVGFILDMKKSKKNRELDVIIIGLNIANIVILACDL